MKSITVYQVVVVVDEKYYTDNCFSPEEATRQSEFAYFDVKDAEAELVRLKSEDEFEVWDYQLAELVVK